MTTNRIVKLNLETRAKALKDEKKTLRQIAAILTEEMKQSITLSAVHRYFAAQDRANTRLIEKNTKLKEKVIELELNTVEARKELIKEIRDLAKQAKESGDIKTAIAGLDKAVTALDSLDKRLGKFMAPESVTAVLIKVVHE